MDRELRICNNLVNKLDLDLRGLTVLTECASGAYAFTPIIALLAGASVIATGSDNIYGTFSHNSKRIFAIAQRLSLDNQINFVHRSELIDDHSVLKANIVTNSGGVRPINAALLSSLNKKAVIALMWETWEFRKDEIDILKCQELQLPVIGSNEKNGFINMFGYNAFIVMRLLFDLGIEGHNCKIILTGSGISAREAYLGLKGMGISVLWYGAGGAKASDYKHLPEILDMDDIDAIINFEHLNSTQLFGRSALLSFQEIKEKLNDVVYGHICGNVDVVDLESSGLKYLPSTVLPFGYMSYETQNLGSRPVLELNALGLKVGAVAARNRLSGGSIQSAIQATVDIGIGQDFEGGFENFKL